MRALGPIVAVLAVLLAPSPAMAEIDAPTIAWFDDQVAKRRYPGVMVALVEGDEVTYRGFGVVDKQAGGTPGADTPFEIGSITKTFTGLALAQLAAEGKVALDDPAQKYVPAGVTLPQVGDRPITLLDLATQRSGLPRLPPDMSPADPLDPYAGYDEAKLWASLAALTPARAAGAGYEYSNLGYGLLGVLLARADGRSYEEMIRMRVLAPLGMGETGFAERGGLAQGYSAGDATPPWRFEALAGAGALRSTARDMVAYLRANLGEGGPEPLRAAAAAAQEPRADLGQGNIRLGLAWMTMPAGKGVWHNGGTYGFQSFAGVDREKRRAVIVWSNVFDVANPLDAVAMHLLNPDIPLPPGRAARTQYSEIVLTPEQLAAYEGSYRMDFGATLTVKLDGDQLTAQLTGQPPVPIYPDASGKFFYKVVEAELSFTRAAGGTVDAVVLHQNGQALPGKKVEP